MSRVSFKYVVDLSLLTRTRADLLLHLLRPYADQLAELGISVAHGSFSEEWLTRLHRVLNSDDARIPPRLSAALMWIGDLATQLGHEILVDEALRNGVDLHPTAQGIPRQDLAFSTYLSHPDLVRAASARLHYRVTPVFVDFYGKRSVIPSIEPIAPKLAVLRHWLTTEYLARNRTAHCRLAVHRLPAEWVLVFAHGCAPRQGPSWSRERIEHHPDVAERSDVAIYEPETDRLSISAPHRMDQELYRAALGFVLSLDEDYFAAWPVYSADPLRERGAASLDARDVSGLDRVALCRIVFGGDDDPEEALVFVGPDLASRLEERPISWLLRSRPIASWTLRLFLAQNAAPLDVHFLPPNQIRIDHGVPFAVLREFLGVRGFERVPPPRRRA